MNYLELDTEKRFGEAGSFVKLTNLDDLQKSSFTADEKKNSSSEIGVGSYHLSDSAWKLFICIRIIESLFSGQSCQLLDIGKLRELFKAMQKVGLTEEDFPQILRKLRKRSTSFRVPKIADTTVESTETESINIQQLGDALLRHIEAALTDNVHILVIDGLDRAIVASNAYWESISSLVRTVDAPVTVPTGCSVFPKELQRPSRRWAERRFPNIRYWNEPGKGGRFAAFEQPALFVDEVRHSSGWSADGHPYSVSGWLKINKCPSGVRTLKSRIP
ncbi:hypothetical protein [Amycolatopsis albidoflavus]|uniref:Uncharacterized protein n=1 Tax=Amycolatopsis albidoflavus TaxID=102226 RepID=A0ABW5I1F8_9PSEU